MCVIPSDDATAFAGEGGVRTRLPACALKSSGILIARVPTGQASGKRCSWPPPVAAGEERARVSNLLRIDESHGTALVTLEDGQCNLR